MSDPIPSDVKRFIRRYVNSVEQLEVLLFLRDHLDAEGTAEAISKKFVSTPSSVEKRLQDLESLGLIARRPGKPGYHYAPKTQRLNEGIGRLAEYYKKHRMSLIE